MSASTTHPEPAKETDTSPAGAGRMGQIKIAIALVLIAGAVGVFALLTRVPGPQIDAGPFQALGQVLAEEAAKLGGARVYLIGFDTSIYPNPSIEHVTRGFFEAASAQHLTLIDTNWINLDPLKLVRVPAGDFVEILRKRAETDVVVSFLGPPLLNELQRARLAHKPPRVVALCSGPLPRQVNLAELFESDLLHVAVISRPNPEPKPRTPEAPRAAFDRLYRVVTPANLADLSAR